MATSPRSVVSLAVAFALAVPALAAAQRTASSSSTSSSTGEVAVPRTDPGSGSSSSGGGSSSSSSSGSVDRGSSSGSSQVIVPETPTFRGGSQFISSSDQRTAPPGSSSGSTATPRGSSGSSSSSGGSSSSSGGSGSSSTSPRGDNGSSVGRSRDGRPASGVATPRETIDINGLSFPVYGPSFARWYPFGSTGFGYNFGYVNYDPWYYSRTRWLWGWNGLWYDPYDPFGYNSWYGYNPYGSAYGYPGYGNSYGGSSKSSDESDHVGSIRLKANPSQAEVYIDGALMGVVDDFDGFSSHLKLAGGTHAIQLKADGYEPYSGNVSVSVGKTVTERISLKKKK